MGSTALQIREAAESSALAPVPPRVGLLRPIAEPSEVIQSQEATRRLVQEALKPGRDFGNVPGVEKPSLLKPGAERINLAFGCVARFRVVEREVDHDREVRWHKQKWVTKPKPENADELKAQGIGRNKKYDNRWVWQERTEENGASLGLYRYVVECELVHRESGHVVASCVGSCSTMESKYIDRPRDSENTVIKMAEKRAFVGATLVAYGLSEQFTQDVEDTGLAETSEGATDGEGATAANTASEPEAVCPKCEGRMWDNRRTKNNPKAPDFKCRDRACDGVLWPGQWPPKAEKDEKAESAPAASSADEDGPDLAAAKRLALMGSATSWDNHGGKALADCPDKVLKHALRFFKEKIREAEQPNPRMEAQVEAIKLVLADRERNSPQEQLGLEGERTTATAAPAAAPAGKSALIDEDDDLPF